MIKYMRKILPPEFEYLLTPLQREGDSKGLKTFFNHLMTLSKSKQKGLIAKVISEAKMDQKPSSVVKWLLILHKYYPEDIGVLSPFYLNLVELAPGQAIFLKAGVLHAYLLGTGIELMANSDNVLRGGLTSKHVDVDELLRILDFNTCPLEVLTPQSVGNHEERYPSPADEFELSIIRLQVDQRYDSGQRPPAPEILLCIDGKAQIIWQGSSKGMDLIRGESVLVPAGLPRYQIEGKTIL
jgi:mannose-6-phosphate isomerase